MPAVDDLPGTVHHDALDRQSIPRKDQGIEQSTFVVANQHGIIGIQRDQIGTGAFGDTCRHLHASLCPACQYAAEQLASHLCIVERCDVARLRYKALSIFEPTQLFKRVHRHLAVRTNGDVATLLEIRSQRVKADMWVARENGGR